MMHFLKNVSIFLIAYLVFLIILFAISANNNKYLLIGYILISIEFIIFVILYYVQYISVTDKIAKILSFSFITYIIHLLVVLPLSLMFISNNLEFAGLQKSVLTVIRVLITLQLYILIIFFLIKVFKKNRLKIQKIFLVFLLSIIISLIIPVPYLQVKFIYFLNSFVPMFLILFILTHLLLLKERFNIQKSFKKYLNPTLTVVIGFILISYIFGLILYFNKWEVFDIGTLYSLKGYQPIEGLPRSWWAQIENIAFIRFPITLENPIVAGYLSAFLSMIMIYFSKYILAFLFFIFTIFSFSKAAIIYLFLYMVIIISSRLSFIFKKIFLKIFNSITMITLLIIAYLGLQMGISAILKTSASIHLLGLTLPFISMGEYSFIEILCGHGIGSGGNFLKAAMGSQIGFIEWLESGSESGIGSIFFQLGLLGLLSIIVISYRIILLLQTIEAKFIYFFYFTSMFIQEDLINNNLLLLMFFTIIIIEFNQKKRLSNE